MADDSKFSNQLLALYVSISPCVLDNTGWSAMQSCIWGRCEASFMQVTLLNILRK